MRRFVSLFVLFLFAIPFGVSVTGCKHAIAPTFCNNGDSGVTAGQITNISLQPIVYGVSLNVGQIGQTQIPTATDCKGQNVSAPTFTYATSDMALADINPANGHLCGGTWNRNTGGGIADYTYCIPTNKTGVAYIAASAGGATSNPLPVFVHPVVTSIVLGGASANCTTDPTTDCAPVAINSAIAASANGACPTSAAYPSNPPLPNGCCTIPPNTALSALLTPPAAYTADSCVSQNQTRQLIARIYAGTGGSQTNISCQAGHLVFAANTGNIVTIDQNGVATAQQPGSTLIGANISNASSSAGFFSTCPPASITLASPGFTGNTPITVNQNTPLPLTATVLDTQNNPITGISLEYVSTQPITIPGGSSTITPALAGAASISAICQPGSCNPSVYNQIGLFGNGVPVTSNSVNIVTPGTNSTVLYMASTQSQYVAVRDFTQPGLAQPFQLPYLPNSMVISNDGANIYMGSSTALMRLNAANVLALSSTDLTSPGVVLAVSPDGNTLVLTDPVKQPVILENTSNGSPITTYGGVGTHAEFSPDSQTVYISAGNQVLVFNSVTGWTSIPASTPVTDVAVTVPAVGAYFAGPITTARGYCPVSTPSGPTTETNIFYPLADTSATATDRIAATNDGRHVLGAAVSPTPTLSDLRVNLPSTNNSGPVVSISCLTSPLPTTKPTTGPLSFSNTFNTLPLTGVTASSITGILPASDSSLALITYAGSGGVLPAYVPQASGAGTLTNVPLSGAAIAPLVGVFTSDNSTAYIGTSGDNLVHVITHTPLVDSSTFNPGLVSPTNAPVPVDLMVQKPRKTT